MKRFLVSSMLLVSCSFLYSLSSQVEFVAEVAAIQLEGESALLVMSLTPEFELTVRVTPQAEIRDENEDALSISDLQAGMILKIEGLYTDEGILAQEIEVTADDRDFELRGSIENVDAASRRIMVLGFVVEVPEEAEIKNSEGDPLLFADLETGQRVEVEGSAVEGVLVASEVEVILPGDELSRIRFEGIVDSIEGSDVLVLIEGVGPALVHITLDTEIKGNLTVGVLVRVIGVIELDLTVTARTIIVRPFLDLAPDELQMHFNQTRRVEVILEGMLETDLELTIASQDPGIAQVSSPTITIPAGRRTGSFEVISAEIEGETLVEVAMPESLGGQRAAVEVEVRAREEEEEEEELELHFRPDELRMMPDQVRAVRLTLSRPAPSELTVALALKEGPAGLVDFPAAVVFEAGSEAAEVQIASGAETGRVEIRATLPESAGGDHDDLEIDIETPEGQELEIEWVPDEIDAGFNETRAVALLLDRPASFDFTVVLTVSEGDAGLVEFPAEVEFAEGSREATVIITTAERSGRATIRAALPFSLGGDTADLEVEVAAAGDEALRVEWIPDEIEVGFNETRTLLLLLNRLAPSDFTAALTVAEGDAELVEFPAQVEFREGSPEATVQIQSRQLAGVARIQAALPESVGGATDDLVVEVAGAEDEALRVEWIPDEIKVGFNETRTLLLLLNRLAPSDFTAALTVVEGAPELVQFPAEVEFREGSREAIVQIQSKQLAGAVKIRAALPELLGGDTDDLVVEVALLD